MKPNKRYEVRLETATYYVLYDRAKAEVLQRTKCVVSDSHVLTVVSSLPAANSAFFAYTEDTLS